MASIKEMVQDVDYLTKLGKDENDIRDYLAAQGTTVAKFAKNKEVAKMAEDGTLPPWAATALQGLTFGWSDEGIAKMRSTFGDTSYEDAVAQERASVEQMQIESPVGAFALEMAGSVPWMLVPGLGATQAVRAGMGAYKGGRAALAANQLSRQAPGLAAKFLAPTAKGAGVGMAQGAIEGAGHAGTGNTREGALLGATVGGLVGGAAPNVMSVGKALGRKAGLGGAKRADEVLGGMVAADAPEGVGQLTRQLDTGLAQQRALRQASGGADDVHIGDIAGENVMDVIEQVGAQPGPGRAGLRQVSERAKAGGRTPSSTFHGEDAIASYDGIKAKMKPIADDLYNEAFDAHPLIADAQLAAAAKTGYGRKAWEIAKEGLEEEADATKRMVLPDVDDIPDEGLPLRAWNEFKVAFDDLVKEGPTDAFGTPKWTKKQRNQIGQGEKVGSRLKQLTGGEGGAYSKALDVWSGGEVTRKALMKGRDVFGSKGGQLKRDFAKMSQQEQEAFKVGAKDALKLKLSRSKPGTNFERLISDDETQDVLGMILSPQERTDLTEMLIASNRRNRGIRAADSAAGSKTARMQNVKEAMNQDADAAMAVGGAPGAMNRIGNQIAQHMDPTRVIGQRYGQQLGQSGEAATQQNIDLLKRALGQYGEGLQKKARAPGHQAAVGTQGVAGIMDLLLGDNR